MGTKGKGFGGRAHSAVAAALVTASLAAGPKPGGSQEIGLYGTAARSDLSEIAATRGAGLHARIFPARYVSLRGAFYRQGDSATRLDQVCAQYIPPVGCNEETIRTDTQLFGFSIAAQLRHRPLAFFEIDGGTGFSLNQIRADEETESGRSSALFLRRSMQFGWLLTGSARARPFSALPLTLELGVTSHRLMLRGCAEAQDFQYDPYDPYCGNTGLQEVRLGVGYNPGW